MSEPPQSLLSHDLPDPETASNVAYMPDFDELRSLSEHLETTTEYGSPAYVSSERSRNADRTKNDVDHAFTADDRDHVREALDRAHDVDLVCLDRRMGRHPDHSYVCRLYVPKEYGRIALAWGKLFDPVDEDREPDFRTLQLPDYEDTRVRIFVDDGVTYVLGSDYTGEAKKSFLRLFMHRAKQAGGLGLHAGTKRVRIRDDEDELREVGQVFLGLSATGKSTLTSHGCWLDDPESARMLQDDVCALLPNGTAVGSEGNGLFIKTYGLDADEQPGLHRAATQPHAVLENVRVDDDGAVDFDDDTITRNGRAIVLREDLDNAAEEIDLDGVDQVFFITRNPLMPPVARLTSEQAAVAFMLGESIQTSAGDPDRAGEAIRVVGTNPFIIGSEGAEGNRFYELVRENDVEAYLMNTGYLGDEDKQIGVNHSVTILTEIARGSIEWRSDERLELELPTSIPGMDADEFYPPDCVEDYETRLKELREDRRAYLEGFEDLRQDIREAAY